ncbi:hypothetical protein [Thermococcus sp.]
MKIDIASYTFHFNLAVRKNMKLIIKNAELAGVYAFVFILGWLFIRVSYAIITGKTISLREIGDVSSIIYIFIASFFVALLFMAKVSIWIHKLDILLGGFLYFSILSLPISSFIHDPSLENALKNLILIILLLFFVVDIKIISKKPSKKQSHENSDSEELSKVPRGYNPT